MGALHFLIPEITLVDQDKNLHKLELFELAGERYLRLWADTQSTGMQKIECKISAADAKKISDAALELRQRIAD